MDDLKKVQADLAAEKLKNTALEMALEAVTAENADLSAQLEGAKSGSKGSVKSTPSITALDETPFTVKGVAYKCVVPNFSHNGEQITVAAVLKDPTLQAELVEGGYGVIQKVEK